MNPHFKLDIRADMREVEKMAGVFLKKHIPYATRLALNETIKESDKEIKREIAKVFDRPTPWTLKSTWIRYAKKGQLSAEVKIKDDKLNARKAAISWLHHSIYGGQRDIKGFEYLLRRYNKMPSNMYAVPTSAMKKDAYGNVSRGELQRVLNDLHAQEFDTKSHATKGSRRRRARSRTKRAVFYFSTYPPNAKTGHLRPGIYQRTLLGFGSAIRPAFVFVSSTRYRVRLRFHEVAHRRAAEVWPDKFNEAFRYAISTAR